MSRAASPFSARAVLAMLVVGAGAFLLFLYAVGAGWNGQQDRDGGAHAAANGVNGFAGLVKLLEAQGRKVSLARSEGALDDAGLLVLTPPVFSDGEAISAIIKDRRYVGATLVILPKWSAGMASQFPGLKAPRGWVVLGDPVAPRWLDEIEGLDGVKLDVAARKRWSGLKLTGTLPDPKQGLAITAASISRPNNESPKVLPLVMDGEGNVLAGYLNDAGSYPVLDDASGYPPPDDDDEDLWPVVIVAEPDLMNNYGFADKDRAQLALALIDATLDTNDLPIVFDLTLPGLGRSENLMTLAFTPPFLAATLCLILAAMVIAWRGLRRFGPPVAEAPSFAMGKRQLARNGAGLIERARRIHLLGPPYAALIAARLAEALGLREADPEARDAAIARSLASRGLADDYPARAEALRRARRPAELLRAAGALRSIERTLTP
jgi:hypothetical protein